MAFVVVVHHFFSLVCRRRSVGRRLCKLCWWAPPTLIPVPIHTWLLFSYTKHLSF
ncbi:hypothetical protein LINPERHAP2_LOCUS24051 [Linum perenne]